MPNQKNSPTAPATRRHSSIPKEGRGYLLSADQCQRLERGFGLPVGTVLRDILADADNAARHRR
jgi:hypothetical protein